MQAWQVAVLAGLEETGVAALAQLTSASLSDELPVVREDPDLFELARSSAAANVAVVAELVQGTMRLSELVPTPQAVAFARELARRNVPVDELHRSYRLGQRALWAWSIQQLRLRIADPAALADAIEGLSGALIATGDRLSALVMERYAAEREQWVRSAEALRRATVEELLSGRPVDRLTASRRLRYELGQRHQAFVLWSALDGAVAESAAAAIAGPRALLVAWGVGVLVGWAPAGSLVPERLDAGIGLALGNPAEGLEGFRASHREALEAHRVARLADADAHGVVAYDDVALLALLTQDVELARAFARRTLGPLAAGDESTRRLADTLYAVLLEQGSPGRAAARLDVHVNTVAKRMRPVEEAIGQTIATRPAEVLSALIILRNLRA